MVMPVKRMVTMPLIWTASEKRNGIYENLREMCR
jgi:hypothetical protein